MFNKIKNSIQKNKININSISNTNNIKYIIKKVKLLNYYTFYYNIEKIDNYSYDIYCYINEKYEDDNFNPQNDVFPFILFNYNEKYNIIKIECFIKIINKKISFINSNRILYIDKNNNLEYNYEIIPVFNSIKKINKIHIIDLIDIIFDSKPNIYVNKIYLL